VGLTVLGAMLREFSAWIRPILEDVPRVALRFLA